MIRTLPRVAIVPLLVVIRTLPRVAIARHLIAIQTFPQVAIVIATIHVTSIVILIVTAENGNHVKHVSTLKGVYLTPCAVGFFHQI